MSKLTGPAHWSCDACRKDGGEVDEDETLPYRWLSFAVLVGCPQTAEEQRTRRFVHLCESCGELLLFSTIIGNSPDIERIRAIFKRPDMSASKTG